MKTNNHPKPTSKKQIYADCKTNTAFYRLSNGFVELSDLAGDSYRYTPEEWQDVQKVDHGVSQFDGFETYYLERHRFAA